MDNEKIKHKDKIIINVKICRFVRSLDPKKFKEKGDRKFKFLRL